MVRRKGMMALMAAAASLAMAAPAAAQHAGHMPGMDMPGMTMPPPAKTPPKKKPAAKKPAAKKPVAAKAPKTKAPARKAKAGTPPAPSDPHAGHSMEAMPAQQSAPGDPHAGHDMSAMPGMTMPEGQKMPGEAEDKPSAADPHAGHDMGSMPDMSMPGHDMGAMSDMGPAGTDLPAGNAPAPPVPTDHAADAVFGGEQMAMSRHHLGEHGGQKFSKVLIDNAEVQFRKGRESFEWSAEAWYGGDINRLWLKSKGEVQFGGPLEKAETQALYSHAIGPYFNLQAGVRHDFKPSPSRTYAVAAVEGLAPYFFELEGAIFLSNKGEVMARLEGSYDQRVTQRLILQPSAELNFAAQNSPELAVGSGLSDAELGLRLRYDIRREFAPYVGVQYRRAFGKTRQYLKADGESAGGWSILTGLRVWF